LKRVSVVEDAKGKETGERPLDRSVVIALQRRQGAGRQQ
jgi:hypothetical protein